MKEKALIILIVFLIVVPIVEAHRISDIEREKVSMAVYGECVGAIFDMVSGQTIHTSFAVKNTGTEDVDITISVERSDETIDVDFEENSFRLDKVSFRKINVSLALKQNTSDIISIDFVVVAISYAEYENPVVLSVITSTYIQVSGEALILNVDVLDQYERPYQGLDVHLTKDLLTYDISKVGEAGTIRYVLASGVYTLKVYEKGVFKKSMDITLIRDTNTTIYVARSFVIVEEGFITINIVEILIGFAAGYGLHMYETKKKKKDDNIVINWSSIK